MELELEPRREARLVVPTRQKEDVEKTRELFALVGKHPQKGACLEALATLSLEAFEKETPPLQFIQFEKGCLELAASRLVKYWKERVKWFRERAFLPMLDLSGNGALSLQEVHMYLRSGSIVQVPDDKRGASVFVVDPERLCLEEAAHDATQDAEAYHFFFRLRMFNLSKCMQERTNWDKPLEMVLIRVMAAARRDMHLITKAKRGFVEVMQAFPIILTGYHFCCVTTVDPSKHYSSVVLPVLLQSMGKEWMSLIHVHVVKDVQTLLQRLRSCGLEAACLPKSLGGTWRYSEFEGWLQEKGGLRDSKMGAASSVKKEIVFKATPRHLMTIPSEVQPRTMDEQATVSPKRPVPYEEEHSAKRVKESVGSSSIPPEGTSTSCIDACLKALQDIKQERDWSIHNLVGQRRIHTRLKSLLSEVSTVPHVRCKQELEGQLLEKKNGLNLALRPTGDHDESSRRQAICKAELRGRLLRRLLSNSKTKSDMPRGTTRDALPERLSPKQANEMRTALISKVLSRLPHQRGLTERENVNRRISGLALATYLGQGEKQDKVGNDQCKKHEVAVNVPEDFENILRATKRIKKAADAFEGAGAVVNSCLAALEELSQDRRCSVRELLWQPCVKTHLLTLVDENSHKSQSKAVNTSKQDVMRVSPDVQQNRLQGGDREGRRKALLRGQLLKRLLSKCKAQDEQSPAYAPQANTLRDALVSKVLTRLNPRPSSPRAVEAHFL